MNTLKTEKRSLDVKAKQIRKQGFVTGNIFGKEIEGSIPIQMSQKEAEHFFKENPIGSKVILEVEGKPITVLVKDIMIDSVRHQLMEVDCQALVKGEKVHSIAEIILLNQEKVTMGIVEQQLFEINYSAYPEDIVSKVEIDIEHMKIGDTIRVSDLEIAKNENIEITSELDAAVVTVIPTHTVEEVDAE